MPINAVSNVTPTNSQSLPPMSSVLVGAHKKTVKSLADENRPLIATVSFAALCSLVFCANAVKGKKTINVKVDKFLQDNYNKIIQDFPEDLNYYRKLAKGLNLPEGEEYKLSSIVGVQQFKSILKNASSSDFNVGADLEGVKNLTHKINLHNHTQASDGQMSIQEFLDNACLYANKRAEKFPDAKYIIAITDHDTDIGIKKAIELISQNPYKYRNLKFVAGAEISVAHIDTTKLTKPLYYEIINYCIDPFNSKYSKFLQNLRRNRVFCFIRFCYRDNQKIS